MGVADELAALRKTSNVKSKSTRLGDAVNKHGFTSPEQLAEERKLKLEKEKQSRNFAQAALHKGASGQNQLNLLYKKLIDEQRAKKKEAELNLRGWRKKHHTKKEGEEEDGSDEGDGQDDNDEDTIQKMLDMLPEHVVKELITKYETDNAAEALSRALKEEEESGDGQGGALAKLMNVIPAPSSDTIDEEEKKDKAKEDKEAEEEKKRKEPPKPKPDLSHIPNAERIELTKRFYNTHTQEYINRTNTADLTPTAHCDTFVSYLPANSTMIDLGCGYGRDVAHFTSLGHHVLGVDYSYEMLQHAKSTVPNAHYINMDIQSLKNILVDMSIDGLWCNASLMVHLPKGCVEEVLKGLYVAVKVGGVLFVSFKIKNGNSNNSDEGKDRNDDDNGGEIFEADERYTKTEEEEETNNNDDSINAANTADDTRRKLTSYYTADEVKSLLEHSGWDIMQLGENENNVRQKTNEYDTHSWGYAFATRGKE